MKKLTTLLLFTILSSATSLMAAGMLGGSREDAVSFFEGKHAAFKYHAETHNQPAYIEGIYGTGGNLALLVDDKVVLVMAWDNTKPYPSNVADKSLSDTYHVIKRTPYATKYESDDLRVVLIVRWSPPYLLMTSLQEGLPWANWAVKLVTEHHFPTYQMPSEF